MSIRLKLILGALSFLLLVVAVFVVTSSVTGAQKTDGLTINLAGRQRMLAERMTKELLAYVESPSQEMWQAFAGTKMTFEVTHKALRDGGAAPTRPLAAQLDEMGEVIPLVDGKVPEGVAVADVPSAQDGPLRTELDRAWTLYGEFVSASGTAEAQARAAKDEGDLVIMYVPQLLARLESALTRAQVASRDDALDEDSLAEWAKVVRYTARQRLITQRIGTLALNYLRSASDEAKAELESAMDIFGGTQESLTGGGGVIRNLDDLEDAEIIAGAPDVQYRERLSEATAVWVDMKATLGRLQTAARAQSAALATALTKSPAITESMNKVVDRAQVLSEKRVATVQTVQIIALILGLIFVIVAALIGSRIGTNVKEAVHAARTIADGDLTHRCTQQSSDETGQLVASLNDMTDQLSQLVKKVQISGVSVGSSSTLIQGSARRQESAVSDLAASATQIAATSSEISATAQELVETMCRVGDISKGTACSAAGSKESLESMQRTMAHMVESTETVTERLAAISEKTSKISSVVSTIMKIAQQTNLISLNAAIEAENAGELGLGFAVVAKEVRRLADQTSKASQGIEQMVDEMQSAVATAVMGMDGFSEDIRCGSDAVSQVAGRLGTIIHEVETLAPQFDAVREGMAAQAQGASQIADGVRQIVGSSEETAESVRETTAAITQLTRAAQELQDGVARFKVRTNGRA